MAALKMKLASMDTTFITGEVVGFDGETNKTFINGVLRERQHLHLINVSISNSLQAKFSELLKDHK